MTKNVVLDESSPRPKELTLSTVTTFGGNLFQMSTTRTEKKVCSNVNSRIWTVQLERVPSSRNTRQSVDEVLVSQACIASVASQSSIVQHDEDDQ